MARSAATRESTGDSRCLGDCVEVLSGREGCCSSEVGDPWKVVGGGGVAAVSSSEKGFSAIVVVVVDEVSYVFLSCVIDSVRSRASLPDASNRPSFELESSCSHDCRKCARDG